MAIVSSLVLVLLSPSLRAGEPLGTGVIRGVVVDQQGRPVSWVQVKCDTVRTFSFETGDDGRFEIQDVPLRRCRVTAVLVGVTGAGQKPDATCWAMPGGEDVALVVDVGAELVVHADGVRFPADDVIAGDLDIREGGAHLSTRGFNPVISPSMSYTDTSVYCKVGRTWQGSWCVVRDGDLVFRRVTLGVPWILYVEWNERTNGTCYREGDSLEPGPLRIELEPGTHIEGTVTFAPSLRQEASRFRSGPRRQTAEAIRGPLRIRGYAQEPDDDGVSRFVLSYLPSGSWEVSYRSLSRKVEFFGRADAGGRLEWEDW